MVSSCCLGGAIWKCGLQTQVLRPRCKASHGAKLCQWQLAFDQVKVPFFAIGRRLMFNGGHLLPLLALKPSGPMG